MQPTKVMQYAMHWRALSMTKYGHTMTIYGHSKWWSLVVTGGQWSHGREPLSPLQKTAYISNNALCVRAFSVRAFRRQGIFRLKFFALSFRSKLKAD